MGMTRRQFIASAAFTGLALRFPPLSANEQRSEEAWGAIREFLFQDREINTDSSVSKIIAPHRAPNGADVSIKVSALSPQTDQKYIKKHYLVADENPSPVIGEFALSPLNGNADITTRIRVDKYTHVRVISETQDNRLHMDKAFVKSSGGCSAPPASDHVLTELTLGKTRMIEEDAGNGMRKIYVSVLHPNNSGLQRDSVTNLTIPPHYVTRVVVTDSAGKQVFAVNGDISFSENPSFEFFYRPGKAGDGVLVATVTDSQEKTYTSNKLQLAGI